MSDYSNLISDTFGGTSPALPSVVGNIDEDPERAQRAMDLARVTGAPSTAIFGDLDEFERQHKAAMASDLVANNPHLSDFVQSNPMVPKIANDDYGTLDSISQKLHNLALTVTKPSRFFFGDDDPLKRWKEGGPLGSWLSDDDLKNHPFASAVAATIGTPIELAFRGATGAIETGADVGAHVGGRDLGALVEAEAMGLTGRGHLGPPEPEAPARPAGISPLVKPELADAVSRTLLYADNAREPLPTSIPEYDAFRADQNAADLDALKETTADAQSSLLRERNPDLFRQYIAQHTDAQIGISGEAVVALYGDKLPEADDGLLGWAPQISDQLNLSRETGADVNIPISDWLTHIDPKVMDALHDDIRVRSGGITAREAALTAEANGANPPPTPLPEEVPVVRAASGLEPMFSVGDRKLALQRMEQDPNTKFGVAQGFHDFNIMDEKGNIAGYLNLSEQNGGKNLYVDMISGVNGLGPRDFGPALMRSILSQIKAEFPNAESISGHRVSGARERAGKEMTMPEASVKLDAQDPQSLDNFNRVLQGGQWETFSPAIGAYLKPYETRSAQDRALVDAVSEELNRIVPNKLVHSAVDTIGVNAGRLEGQTGAEAVRAGGAYLRYRDTYPMLLWALDADDALGTARHEAIHHLRQYGFFSKNEWNTLEAQALAGGWLDKYNIDRRYPTGSPSLKLEESIAEAYMDWARGAEAPTPEVHGLFERLKAFLSAIRDRVGALLGKDPTWEDIFKRVDTGEVGGREGMEPLEKAAFNERLSVEQPPEDPSGGSRVFERASALGMTVDQFRRYDELMQERHAKDISEATARATAEQTREQTKQWKEDRKALRQEVASDIRQRPDVAADLFLGAGELYGKKVPLGSVKLDASALTDVQKAALPRNYYGAHGLHPDEVANLFGYGSGDAMLEHLAAYNVAKLTAGGMSAKDFVSRVTDIETDRQMRIKYGVLDDNVIDAVKEQVSGEVQQNLLHEETHALGMKVGAAPLDKTAILSGLRDAFAKMPMGSVSSDAYLAAAGKAGRQAELALLAEDPATAFRAKQQQYYATVIANEAVKLERDVAKFEKVTKRFSKREIATVDQEYTNFIHDILLRIGRPVRRSIQDLETEIAAGEYKDLQSFVEGKNGFYLREVAVADQFFDPNYRKDFADLTVDEFRGTKMSIDSLVANGRSEKKITKAGADADLAEIKGQMINQLREFQERTYDAKGGRWMGPIPPKVAKVLRTYGTSHIQMENLFNRWDHDNPQGVFQQYIMRDLVDAANNESAMEKRYAAKLREIDDKADLKKLVDNPLFKVPGTEQLMQLNRGNLRAILLNAGNPSNFDKMARGYKLDPQALRAWLDRHATKEDWDWAQKMGDIFKELKAEADIMYRNLSGVAPESIRVSPIQTVHGEYPGWYYPLIAHPEFEGAVKKMMGKDALEQDGFVRATTANGYTKSRTGVAYPLALDLDTLPARMKQMIHDVAMRPSVINASKIFYDKDIRSAIFSHFGAEWRDMLVPYLVDVANSANYLPKNQRLMMNASEFLRQNIISTLVGLNPGTVLKHGPTALVQSLNEVGAVDFLKALKGLTSINDRTGESNWTFAINTSEELQRRHQNYVETLGGATDLNQPTSGFGSFRAAVQRFGATPVAISDLLSAVPTWLAQYEKSMDAGDTHGDAVYMADRAVRRAHGSVAITNRSQVMRGGALGQWFASVYGFFNHIMNRQYEMLWKAGEMIGEAKEGNYREAMARAPELTSMLFAYVLAPALIEEMVTPLVSSDGESWGKKAAKGVAFTLGASWVGVRDIANALLNGRDPTVGLISTAAKTITDFGRDLGKRGPFSKEHAGKVARDGATLLGALTGVVPAQAGRVAQFGTEVAEGTEHPRGPWGWLTGLRYGTLDKHARTWSEWQRHHIGGR